MKKNILSTIDEALLKKRWSIKSVGNTLKSKLSLEHSHHRSISGCIIHLIPCLLS